MYKCPTCGNVTAFKNGMECQPCEIRRLQRLALYEHERRLEAVKRFEQAVNRLQRHNHCEDCERNGKCHRQTRRARARDKAHYYCDDWKYIGKQEASGNVRDGFQGSKIH